MSFDTDLTNRSDATYLVGTQGTVGISLEYLYYSTAEAPNSVYVG